MLENGARFNERKAVLGRDRFPVKLPTGTDRYDIWQVIVEYSDSLSLARYRRHSAFQNSRQEHGGVLSKGQEVRTDVARIKGPAGATRPKRL